MLAPATANDMKPGARSALRPRGGVPRPLRPSLGNQASLRFLGRQASDATGEQPWGRGAREAGPQVITIRKLALVKPQTGRKGRACCADCANDPAGKTCGSGASAQRDISDAGAAPVPADKKTPPDAGTNAPDAGPKDGGPNAPEAPACPAETITISGPGCGARYGATAKYCLAGAAGWWFKESVVNAPGAQCQPGSINQTSNPIQSTTGCVADAIFNTNGPPASVSPCKDLTNQIVFAGPTQATVTQCQYAHDQLITVAAGATAGHGTVTTSTGGQSTFCNF